MTTSTEPFVATHRGRSGPPSGSPDADPITTEVIRFALEAAADQMRVALKRTAFSPVIYEMTDFAAALYDRQVRLLAQAQALPLFLGTLGFTIEATLERIGGEANLAPGDVIFSTHGYDMGSHPQDATIVVPGFIGEELVGYAVVKAHHLDMGAKAPYCTDTTDLFQEGVILPGVRVYRRGELQEDIYRTILANSRFPRELAGDLKAQIGAANVGLGELYRIIERVGAPEFERSVERMFDHGEQVMRAFFRDLPDGRYEARGTVDNNGVETDEVPLDVVVEVDGSDVTVDLTDSPPMQPGPINCPIAATVSAAWIGIVGLTDGVGSVNEGHLRGIAVKTRPGTLFHPSPPAPIYLRGRTVFVLVDMIHHALAPALGDRASAGSGGDLGGVIFWGVDEDGVGWADGADHVVGQGADSRGDSVSPLMFIPCSGVTSVPIEVLEARRPMLVERCELATDSGGPGRFRGGPGVDAHYRALRDWSITTTLERTRTAPWGLEGGGFARSGSAYLRRLDGTRLECSKVTGLVVKAGEVLEVATGGGGGFGRPEDRDASAVRDDVRQGYVSADEARRVYGVDGD